jgi:signal transduction histidine kinase
MTRAAGRRTLRAELLGIVLVAVVAPLALLGLWLARGTADAGERLLRDRLNGALGVVVRDVGERWVTTRGALLELADHAAVRAALAGGHGPAVEARPILGSDVREVVVRDTFGVERWRLARDAPMDGGRFTVRFPLRSPDGTEIGTLEATLVAAAVLAPRGASSGASIGAVDRATGGSLLPLSFDAALARGDAFTWDGERWLAARYAMQEPPVDLIAAAPLADYVVPFRAAARRGVLVLVGVAVLCVFAAAALTSRTTRALEDLATTADAVASGDLGRTAHVPDGAEVGRLARAFNTMSESLRRTLDALARRESLAAVGEFAAGLAHEVRNPLTAMRIDLQRAQEKLDDQSPLRGPIARALGQVERLDATVSGALRLARSGQVSNAPVDVLVPLDAAVHAAEPALSRAGAVLDVAFPPRAGVLVRGDPAALEQLFLNLLLNAAQALDDGGAVHVGVHDDGAVVRAVVRDAGRGMNADVMSRLFEPFYTTRAEGTGLGLALARRIARAHGGEIDVESAPGAGTTVTVRLPRGLSVPAPTAS